jgi:virulence-associated protein VapD
MAAAIGHNRGPGRKQSMYAIVFDFDTDTLQQTYPTENWRDAYRDVRTFLTQRGFEWRQGSAYFGNDSIDAVRCITVVQRLSRKYPWFVPSVRDLRMLRIEENNDLKAALEDEED